ncbi:MAG: lipid-binding SYLF domain-containing protein [Gemmataceae bacterium]
MTNLRTPFTAILLLLSLATTPLYARGREVKTLEMAAKVVQGMSMIPWGMLHEAAGIAIIPHAFKAALVLDEEFGRGVVVFHEPDGRWSNPVFVTLRGSGLGGQVGVESTDLVLVFMTRKALDRALQGRRGLGEDFALAAGPIGRDVQIAHEGRLKADIYSYSRSRGLFAGVSLGSTRLRIDAKSNKTLYGGRQGSPAEVFVYRGASIAAVETLKASLLGLQPAAIVAPVAPPRRTRRR